MQLSIQLASLQNSPSKNGCRKARKKISKLLSASILMDIWSSRTSWTSRSLMGRGSHGYLDDCRQLSDAWMSQDYSQRPLIVLSTLWLAYESEPYTNTTHMDKTHTYTAHDYIIHIRLENVYIYCTLWETLNKFARVKIPSTKIWRRKPQDDLENIFLNFNKSS